MAKTDKSIASEPASVRVVLTCAVVLGAGVDICTYQPGAVVDLPCDEAGRLVALGAARAADLQTSQSSEELPSGTEPCQSSGELASGTEPGQSSGEPA